MRRYFIIAAKSALALLSLMSIGLLYLAGYLVWYYEHGIGLPDFNRLAAVSATGPACSTDPQRPYIPLAEIPPLLRKAMILQYEPDFYERWSICRTRSHHYPKPQAAAVEHHALPDVPC